MSDDVFNIPTPFADVAALGQGYAMRADNDNEHDNKAIISRMVALRAERSSLMGYDSHAHFILSDNMAENPDNVYGLLDQVWKPALERSIAERVFCFGSGQRNCIVKVPGLLDQAHPAPTAPG